MVIRQGDVFWAELEEPIGSSPGYRHPCVVVQNNLFNASRINTVVVCSLSSNLARAKSPGNVRLAKGEARLPKPSVVVVSQVFALDRSQIGEYIGHLSPDRVKEILEGLYLLLEPREVE